MAEQLGELTRTHTCGALRPGDVGADVVLLGWVHRVRDLGGLLFIDIRDRGGVTQAEFDRGVEAPAAEDLLDGFHRRIRRARGNVAFEIGLAEHGSTLRLSAAPSRTGS